jgi:hypothetical protein
MAAAKALAATIQILQGRLGDRNGSTDRKADRTRSASSSGGQ